MCESRSLIVFRFFEVRTSFSMIPGIKTKVTPVLPSLSSGCIVAIELLFVHPTISVERVIINPVFNTLSILPSLSERLDFLSGLYILKIAIGLGNLDAMYNLR